jgi:hypothetical protein
MSRSLVEKAYKAFSTSKTHRIYLRDRETEEIKPFVYINYLSEPKASERIMKSRKPVVVIDEFDRFYRERNNDCLQCIRRLEERGIKLITLSNDLRLGSDALFFKPYSAEEMSLILEKKIEEEVHGGFMSSTAIALAAKRFEGVGDLRLLFKHMQEILEIKMASGSEGGIMPSDIVGRMEGRERGEGNVHHEMITRLMARHGNRSRMKVYSEYLRECSELKIMSYDRVDFGTVFDMYL